jgi:hypothetical protein
MQKYVELLWKNEETFTIPVFHSKTTNMELLGPQIDIQNASTKIDDMARAWTVTVSVQLGIQSTSYITHPNLDYQFTVNDLAQFLEIGHAKGVEISPGPSGTVILKGSSRSTALCKEAILAYRKGFPPLWTPQIYFTELVDVSQNSAEWSLVQSRFNQTLKNPILAIQRIQNKNLWVMVT